MSQASNGSMNVTVVAGTSYTGLYAADGSTNVVETGGITPYAGAYAPCGALNVSLYTTGISPIRAADGSLVVDKTGTMPPQNTGQPVTVVSGSLG